jgi:hypothetical protein
MIFDFIIVSIILSFGTGVFLAKKKSRQKLMKVPGRKIDHKDNSQSNQFPRNGKISKSTDGAKPNIGLESPDENTVGNFSSNNPLATDEGLLSFLSQLPSSVIDDLKAKLLGIESNKGTGLNNVQEIARKINQIKINDDEYFQTFIEEITEDPDGRIWIKKTISVYDCGCSMKNNKLGGLDWQGHLVCQRHLLWCERGSHPCCSLDSKKLKNNKIACIDHSGLMYLRTWPIAKLKRVKRFFKKLKYKREIII